MNESAMISTEHDGTMTVGEANQQFLAALRHLIREQRKTQVEIAEVAGCSKNHLNAAINERGGTTLGSARQEAIARYFNYSLSEFLALGKRVLENVPGNFVSRAKPEQAVEPARPVLEAPSDYLSYDALSETLAAISRSFRKADDRRKFWRNVVEQFPLPTLIIRDWTVVYQNKASRDSGLLENAEVCLGCGDISGCDHEDCVIHTAMRTHTHEVTYKQHGMTGTLCRIDVTPLLIDEHNHYIVSYTPIEGYGEKAEELHRLRRQSAFIASCEFSQAGVYIDIKTSMSAYLNRAMRVFLGISEGNVLSLENFIILIHKRLASGRILADAIDTAMKTGEPDMIKARVLQSTDILHFIIRPHYHKGEVLGLLLIALDKVAYSYYQSVGLV